MDRTVSASVILNQIAAGEPVEYDGDTIEGALDLDTGIAFGKCRSLLPGT